MNVTPSKNIVQCSESDGSGDEKDYVVPPSKNKSSKGKSLVRQDSQGSRQQSVGVPKVHPLLAQLVGDPSTDPADAIQALQTELILERSGGRHSLLNNCKRFYTISTTTVGNGTFQHIAVGNPGVGTTTANRESDVISGLSITCQCNWMRLYSGAPVTTTNDQPVTIRWVLWRDKVPATPGTATATLATSTNPPASNVEMFSRLGQASIVYNTVAIKSPDTFDRYHIYDQGEIHMNVRHTEWNGTSIVAYGQSEKRTVHKDLHNVEVSFASEATANPMLNAIYFSFFSDFNYTGANYTDNLIFTSDFAFRDKQI